jgi:hypothetical protein
LSKACIPTIIQCRAESEARRDIEAELEAARAEAAFVKEAKARLPCGRVG